MVHLTLFTSLLGSERNTAVEIAGDIRTYYQIEQLSVQSVKAIIIPLCKMSK